MLSEKIRKVEVSNRNTTNIDIAIIDGSALRWVIHWPVGRTVKTYVSISNNILRGSCEWEMCLIINMSTANGKCVLSLL